MRIKKTFVSLLLSIGMLSSCVVHDHPSHHYGPHGYDGLAFFGIDYEYSHPYSYWDNNPSVPYNPRIGTYHETGPGIYEFEYYINPHEFWYGTYEIWINYGEPGRPHGQPGLNGLDTYLMMICDPMGYYEIRGHGKLDLTSLEDKPLVIERKEGKENFKLTIFKGNPSKRKTHAPKYKRADYVEVNH